MFIVEERNIKVKRHQCSTYYLAQFVLRNLERRWSDLDLTIDSNATINAHWDGGGSVLEPKKHFTIPVDETLNIVGYLHHWESFYISANKLLAKQRKQKYDNMFYKLHGAFINAICVTETQRTIILREIENRNEMYKEELKNL